MILQIAYGIYVSDETDEYLRMSERVVEAVSSALNAGSYMVDMLPFCELCFHAICQWGHIVLHSETYSRVASGCWVQVSGTCMEALRRSSSHSTLSRLEESYSECDSGLGLTRV